ncbi:MAG TPA: sugar ABC transporter permease [Aggregatilineaceae bacterium]|nr:sugar ABC transporter permease [Aggregatilineaceae bacterium]
MLRNKVYPFYFSLGTLILYSLFFVIPAVMGFGYAFTDWNRYTSAVHYVGTENFRTVLSNNDNYIRYARNTALFSVSTIILKTVLGLSFALLLHNGVKHLRSLYRLLIFLPAVLPMVVVGIMFKSVLDPRRGLLNEMLRDAGLKTWTHLWLADPKVALYSIIGVDTWKGAGYIMVILLAGLQTIPDEYYEAAQIDGANAQARLRHITIPLLMPALIVSTVLSILHGLKIFDVVYVLTNGGPGYSTEVLYTAIFKEFSKGRYSIGTAISTLLFLVMVFIGYFVIRLMERGRTNE